MKTIVKTIFIIILFLFGLYLLLPLEEFPREPIGAIVSNEPADVEDINRRGYFTNFTRSDVISHYKDEFKFSFFGINIFPIRLNYPPEESKLLIRDQTRSTFLEELIFPFRESIFINGFEPKEDKDVIVVNREKYRQKIIVKHNASKTLPRFILGMLSVIFIYLFISNIYDTVGNSLKKFKNK